METILAIAALGGLDDDELEDAILYDILTEERRPPRRRLFVPSRQRKRKLPRKNVFSYLEEKSKRKRDIRLKELQLEEQKLAIEEQRLRLEEERFEMEQKKFKAEIEERKEKLELDKQQM